MKRIVLILCVLFVLLIGGCRKTPQISTPVSSSPDGITNASQILAPTEDSQANLRNYFVETEMGYYYQNNNLIYFSQRGDSSFFPLCNKPNCTHDNENCNAWCGIAFGYYNDALYSVLLEGALGKFNLVKMNLDGTDHTVVTHLDANQGGGFQFYFHHGKLYIYASPDLNLPLDDQTDRLIILNLSDYSQTEPFIDFFHAGNRFSIISFYKDKLYVFAENNLSQDSQCILELNAETGEVRELLSLELGILYATDSTLFYLEPNVGFREYNLESGEIKDCGLPIKDAWWAAYDVDYIYLMGYGRNNDNDHTLYFLSRDYELLDQIDLTNGLYYNYAASDRLYFSNDFGTLTFYLEKTMIAAHSCSLEPLSID